MKHNKIFFIPLIIIILCLSITGCQKKGVEQTTGNNEVETKIEEVSENKFLLIDTENYKIKMDIFGDWKTYSGQTELKDNTVAFLIPEDTLTDSPYFYISVEKYNNKDNLPIKDHIVNILNEKYSDLELESVYEYDNPKRVKLIYSVSNSKQTIKSYEVVYIQDDYQISYVYKAPELLYIQEKGYIDDMIESAVFTKIK